MPFDKLAPLTANMNATSNDNSFYWHVQIYEKDKRFYIGQPTFGSKVEVTSYLIPHAEQE